jgi:acyl-CoA thioester hydrolase
MGALTPADFPFLTFDKIRYADTDRQGHVNNAVYATFLETGRAELLYNPEQPLMSDGGEFVIASLNLAFEGELHWPGEVKIGTYIRRLGNSSIHIGQALFQGEHRVAEAETVVVQVDQSTRKAMPLSQDARVRLGEFTLEQNRC